MSLKKVFQLLYCIQLLIFLVPSFAEDDSVVITSQFGDNLETHFQTGIDLQGKDLPFFAKEDCELVFVNKKRPNSIRYSGGNLILLQNRTSNLRYYYSGIADNSYDERILNYSQGEFIGLAGNSGINNKETLHVELENVESHKLLNPALFFDMPDTEKPVINDLFFIDIHNQEISLFKSKPRSTLSGSIWITMKSAEVQPRGSSVVWVRNTQSSTILLPEERMSMNICSSVWDCCTERSYNSADGSKNLSNQHGPG